LLKGFEGGDREFVLSAIAAHNGTLVCSMLRQNELLLVDANSGTLTGRRTVPSPRGIALDDQGRLLVLSGNRLLRFDSLTAETSRVLIENGLEDPRHIARGAQGQWLISDRGQSHQVKVFDANGRLVRSIGRAGPPATGTYDPLHINHPNGLAVDSLGRVWVAENDNFPRRVSVWSADGQLVRAFYGPTEYGGGGVLDPRDPSVFFYKGLEFALDWQTGADSLKRVFARPHW
jgi:DNA-binding beta-propeller fold protein YncE